MAEDDRPTLGEQIRARRQDVELTQAEIAAYVGVNRVTIRALEQGRNVESRTRDKVVALLGCTVTTVEQFPPGVFRPVLSVRLTRRIHGLLASLLGHPARGPVHPHHVDPEDQQRKGLAETMLDSYLDVVEAAAAATEPVPIVELPPGLDLLRSRPAWSDAELRMFDMEMSRIFGDPYPYPPSPTPPERTLVIRKDGTDVRGDEVEKGRQKIEITESALGAPRQAEIASARRRAGESVVGHGRRATLDQTRALAQALEIVLDADLPGSVMQGLSEYLLVRVEDPNARLVDEARAMIALLERMNLFPSTPLEE